MITRYDRNRERAREMVGQEEVKRRERKERVER
jgi:hypothetical protein